ncbi:hypothetical protein MCUN1_003136 [Malassezia cuniculi]|uniref:Ribosomal protein/NADH dehydrogenase domain-containing protein n=1 Tax=Malassezia cuniculi TaxID=948313 RepID=A0AAF0ESK5_9BASI|nr:hypothetical protein MCUN1_003136 [Malassezia cuniculi]
MAKGAKSAASLRTLVASLEASVPSHRLPPTLTALQFTVPRTFNTPRIWELMRRELPRIAYANPDLRIGVNPIESGTGTGSSSSNDADSASGASASASGAPAAAPAGTSDPL